MSENNKTNNLNVNKKHRYIKNNKPSQGNYEESVNSS